MIVNQLNDVLTNLVLEGGLDVATLARSGDGFAFSFSLMHTGGRRCACVPFGEGTEEKDLLLKFNEEVKRVMGE